MHHAPRVLSLVVWLGAGGVFAAESAPPNVLLIIADDLNREVGCYGAQAAVTPHIDRLAAEGVRFAHAYGQGAVCTPSRNSFITGLSTRTTGIHDQIWKKRPTTMSLGRYFRQHGYETVALGKVEHTVAHQDPQAWSIRPPTADTTAKVIRNERRQDDRFEPGKGGARIINQVYADQDRTSDELRTDQFADFLQTRTATSKPFLVAVGFHNPHEPHMVHQRHLDAHPLDRMPLVHEPQDATPFNPVGFSFVPWFPDEATQRFNVQSYYAAVTAMDEQVGRTLALLDQYHLSNSTVVVFIGDNGYNLGYRGQWAKHDLYPDVIHQPLLVRYPPLAKAGATADGVVEYLDIFPTLADVAGLPVPAGLDGRSFRSQLLNPDAPGKEAAYAEWNVGRDGVERSLAHLPPGTPTPPPLPAGLTAVRGQVVYTHDWCYVEYPEVQIGELYHLATDPQAYRNVASQHPDVVARHAALVRAYFSEKPRRTAGKSPVE